MKAIAAATLCAAFVLMSGGMAGAASPIQVLSQIPDNVFDAGWVQSDRVSGGLDWPNQRTWHSVQYQRFAMDPLQAGAVRANAAQVATYFPVVERGFQYQNPDGSFVDDQSQLHPKTIPTAVSFFIGESAQALLLVRESSFAPAYASRIDALLPRYRLTLNWLSQPSSVANLIAVDNGAYNRLLDDAKALLLGDRLVGGGTPAHQVGENLLDMALSAQTAKGYFPEKGGSDTSYNAVSCMHVAELALWVSDQRLKPSLQRCVAWELEHLNGSGEVDTVNNTRSGPQFASEGKRWPWVNYREVARMFGIAGEMGVPGAAAAAKNVAGFMERNNLITPG